MSIRFVDGEIRLLSQKTRMPFRYGIATMTEFPLLFLRVSIEINGRLARGVSSDLLPPKWFTKIAEKDPDEEIGEMLEVIRRAIELARGLDGDSIFALWWSLYERQSSAGRSLGEAPLLSHFGTSLVERAMIDAFARDQGISFHALIKSNALGVDLGRIHPVLEGSVPSDWVPPVPLATLTARHTVGLGDPLATADLAATERVDDGLPQSLEECIDRYGLRHFKIKIGGNPGVDFPRLREMVSIVKSRVGDSARYTLDGNEQFSDGESWEDYWQELRREPWFGSFAEKLLFVEQPLHRKIALDVDLGRIEFGGTRPLRVLIDESDAELGSLPRALNLGYAGTSHKNCKGVFKGLANRCLIEYRQRTDRDQGQWWMMSGEDLCNQGPVALLQDLAVMACLGIESVERNGHHYCHGLEGLDKKVRDGMLHHHADLYEETGKGWLGLRIAEGSITLGSINESPFGVGYEVPLNGLQTLAEWDAGA